MKKLSITFILLCCLFCENLFSQDQQTPNIIVMYSDDPTAQSIGAYQEALNYGLKQYHTPTPNTDRLAEDGMQFDNAFVTNSIYVPSRAVLLSGMHSHMTGVVTTMESMPVDLETFPVTLQQNGYQTAMIEKWHISTDSVSKGFDVNITGFEAGNPAGWDMGGYFSPYNNPHLEDGPEGEYLTDRLTDETIAFLEKKG